MTSKALKEAPGQPDSPGTPAWTRLLPGGGLAGLLKLACALACLAVVGVRAQDAEAITRAQRDAANPLRMIIEASKLKPRQKAAEDEPVAKAPPVKAAARPQPARQPAAAVAQARDAVPESVASAAIAATPAPNEPAPPLAQPDAPLPNPMQASTPPDQEAPPAAPAAQASAPAQAEASAPYDPDNYFGAPPPMQAGAGKFRLPAPGVRQALAATAPSAEPTPRAVLQLADYVEPALPDRVRRKLQGDGEVVLGFTVNPDGSVSDVAVRSASDKALEAVAVDAVRQWRYKPIASAQAHGVQLVFKLGE